MIDSTPNEKLATPPKFVVGRVYDRWPEINDPYGGSRQSGISTSRQVANLCLLSASLVGLILCLRDIPQSRQIDQ